MKINKVAHSHLIKNFSEKAVGWSDNKNTVWGRTLI